MMDISFNDDYAKEFVLRLWKRDINKSHTTVLDSKTKLQEYSLKKYKTLPEYKLLSHTGPRHKPVFKIGVSIENSTTFNATGYSKKDAEYNKKCNDLINTDFSNDCINSMQK